MGEPQSMEEGALIDAQGWNITAKKRGKSASGPSRNGDICLIELVSWHKGNLVRGR